MSGGRAISHLLIFLALGASVVCSAFFWKRNTEHPTYGFTFSSMYAESLGLNAQEALLASLHELHPAFVRFPLYWDVIEPTEGTFSWKETDAQVTAIKDAGADIHMVIGAKVPRWPECFIPAWAHTKEHDVYREELLSYMRTVVERYAPVTRVWQVENEPLFAFGDCPDPDIDVLKEEVALVRALDPDAQIQITVSGEQQIWGAVATLADRIGVSMYRNARSALFGSFSFPVPTLWYTFMRIPVAFTHTVVLSELQMEPWFTSHPRYIAPAVAASFFTPQEAQNTLAYARATGFSEISFWGVEWWYYLREQGYPALWDMMKKEMN